MWGYYKMSSVVYLHIVRYQTILQVICKFGNFCNYYKFIIFKYYIIQFLQLSYFSLRLGAACQKYETTVGPAANVYLDY